MNINTLETLCDVFEETKEMKNDENYSIDCFYTYRCFDEMINQILRNYKCLNKYKIILISKEDFIIKNLNTNKRFNCYYSLNLKSYYNILRNHISLFNGRTYESNFDKRHDFLEILKYCYGAEHFRKNLKSIRHLPKNDFEIFKKILLKYNSHMLKSNIKDNFYDATFEDVWFDVYGYKWNGSKGVKNILMNSGRDFEYIKTSTFVENSINDIGTISNNLNFSTELLGSNNTNIENYRYNLPLSLAMLTPITALIILFILLLLFYFKRK